MVELNVDERMIALERLSKRAVDVPVFLQTEYIHGIEDNNKQDRQHTPD